MGTGMFKTPTSVWIFAAVWLALATSYTARAFGHSADRSLVALIDWGVIAVALAIPPFALWRLFADLGSSRATINAAVRLVIVSYLPIWTAMRLLERALPPR
jgi:hypothetical protein